MRPIELKIKGINSYREEQVINFNQLTSQGFFGIFGPTGSGKSTILEAIHLALTGMYNGRGIRNELSPYLFNNQAVKEYLDSLTLTLQPQSHLPLKTYLMKNDKPELYLMT